MDESTRIDGDADRVAGRVPPSQRRPLDRDRIIATAVDFIREHGLASLTMRRLGDQLGVEAMSLYRYVPGKEDLLDAVVETLVEQMRTDPEVLLTPENGWQDFLQRMAHGIRRIALQDPQAFPLVASRPAEAPWLRPPLRSLDWVENFLSGLKAEGFSSEAAVQGYRAFTSFLLGHLLLEVAALGADLGPLDVLDDGSLDQEGDQQYPLVHALRVPLSQDRSSQEFDEALEALLERMTLLRTEDQAGADFGQA